jgi:uncharacterized protein YjbJ (UPF0337 family)
LLHLRNKSAPVFLSLASFDLQKDSPSPFLPRSITMGINDKINAAAKDAEGKLQAAAGELTGDPLLKAKGDAKQVQAKVIDAAGDLGDKVADAADVVGDKVAGVAGAVGNTVAGAAGDLGDKVAGAADAVGDKVADTADAIGDKVADAAEAIGNVFKGLKGKA